MSWVGGCTALIAGVLLMGCGSDDDGGADIADQPLGGMIGPGQPGDVDGGKTDHLLSDEETLFASLYFGPYHGCGDLNTPADMIITSFPAETGTYEIGPDRGVTFYIGGENLRATEGVIVVDEITDTTASIGLRAIHDEDVHAEGWTEVDICPPP